MSADELQLLKEGLMHADRALACLMEINNEHCKALSNLLHGTLVFGETLLEEFKENCDEKEKR